MKGKERDGREKGWGLTELVDPCLPGEIQNKSNRESQ